MCDWGGGPLGNGAYDSYGITKHGDNLSKSSAEYLEDDIMKIMDDFERYMGYSIPKFDELRQSIKNAIR